MKDRVQIQSFYPTLHIPQPSPIKGPTCSLSKSLTTNSLTLSFCPYHSSCSSFLFFFSKMPKKHVTYFSGHAEVQPWSNNVSNEVQNKVRSSYSDQYSRSSTNVTKSYKASEYVADKSTGQMGYRQKAKYTCTDRYVDKDKGFTTEYKTQWECTKSVYPNKSSSSNNRINYY